MTHNKTSILNIKFIFCILFFIELKWLVWYSSNIYFFVLFLLILYLFFTFFSKVVVFKDFFFELIQLNYTIYSFLIFNKIKYSLKIQLVHYNVLFKFYVIKYRMLLHKRLKTYLVSINYFLLYLKSCFI